MDRKDDLITRPQAFQGGDQTLAPVQGGRPINDVLAIATKIRSEYGARDGQINNANNPVGNFRAWSRALDLARQIIGQKQNLLSSGGQIRLQDTQTPEQTQANFTPPDELPQTIETQPETGYLEPLTATNTTERKQFGVDTLFPEGKIQQSNPEISRTFSEPKVNPSAVTIFGHF